MNIRSPERADFERWLPLWDGYNAFYGRSGSTALAPEITAVTWARFFDPYEPVYAFLAEADEQIVGLAHFLLHRSTTAMAPSCYLQDLFTVETARGKGVGRALIEAVYGWARTAGCGRVYWQTHESNAQAQRLYNGIAERSGFIVYRKIL
jgi:GNAT superfamily N-acetyltransferase